MSSLERRESGRRRGVLDRHSEADADEHTLLGGIEKTCDDADYLTLGGDERAAGVAGIHGGVELDQVAENTLAVLRLVLALQPGDHAGGNRRADAEREADRHHLVAEPQAVGRADRGGKKIVGN